MSSDLLASESNYDPTSEHDLLPKPAGQLCILVVDDDDQVLDVLGEMLRLEGFQVDVAENGQIALEKTNRRKFDLVITDLIMPEREGLEIINHLRKRPGCPPILAISGGGRLGPTDYLETARLIGADATLAKPFGRQDFITQVLKLLATHD